MYDDVTAMEAQEDSALVEAQDETAKLLEKLKKDDQKQEEKEGKVNAPRPRPVTR